MRVVIDGVAYDGPAVELDGYDLDSAAVVRAVTESSDRLTVECPEPGPVYDRVGHVTEGMTVALRSALAAVARSRGLTAPQDEAVARVREQLDSVESSAVDTERSRRRVAELSGAEAELRERVATLRGRVRARREAGLDAEEATAALADATRELSETETERIAAEQAHRRAQAEARAERRKRRERLRLEDERANLERAARKQLADRLRDEFEDARRAISAGRERRDGGEAVTAALAVARLADVDAPLVLACERFDSAAAAVECLDAPVIRL